MAANEDQLANSLGRAPPEAPPSFISAAFVPPDQRYQPAQIRLNWEAPR